MHLVKASHYISFLQAWLNIPSGDLGICENIHAGSTGEQFCAKAENTVVKW